MLFNNDYLKGYVSALENIDSAIDNLISNATNTCAIKNLQNVKKYILETKENYKQLVKDLNESQSKKTT